MSSPIHVSDADFESQVLKSDRLVVVDFWAPWCSPCKRIAPVLEQIAAEQEGRLIVAKVNTDEDPQWAIHYGVQGIPTLLFVRDGEVVDRQTGALPAGALRARVEKVLQTAGPETT